MNAILTDRDYTNAWAHMTDELRLVRSQAWLWNNRNSPGAGGSHLGDARQRCQTLIFFEQSARRPKMVERISIVSVGPSARITRHPGEQSVYVVSGGWLSRLSVTWPI